VAAFEREFAHLHGAAHGVAVTSCTTALHLALLALGIGPGDEVVLPSFTWIATANAVEYVGARPVLCDVDPRTYNLDPDLLAARITPRTRAVIPVHLFGLCAPMEEILSLCRPRGIAVVEDAACASGASARGRMAGTFGEVGCFSFHPRKVITTGEGGMCLTGDEGLAGRLRMLRNHGAAVAEEDRHRGPRPFQLPEFPVLGYNYRMTDLQGAVGLAQLRKLPALLAERRRRAAWYRERLAALPWLATPAAPDGFGHTWQSFVCRVDESRAPLSRDGIMEALEARGIASRPGTHAVHLQAYYVRKYGFRPEDFPASLSCQRETIALPLHSRMDDADFQRVAAALDALP
jgi:dTDP-4-amino-4,6-dideoxygalactose transaminase